MNQLKPGMQIKNFVIYRSYKWLKKLIKSKTSWICIDYKLELITNIWKYKKYNSI